GVVDVGAPHRRPVRRPLRRRGHAVPARRPARGGPAVGAPPPRPEGRRERGMTHPAPPDAFRSPRLGQPATLLRLPGLRDPAQLGVAILGIPYDGGTSYRPGARYGPRAVRDQSSLIRPWNPVLNAAPFKKLRVADAGDVDVVPIAIERTFEAIE